MNYELAKRYILGKCSVREIEELNEWVSQSEDNARWLFKMADAYHTERMMGKIDDACIQQAEVDIIRRIIKEESVEKRRRTIRLFRYAAAAILLLLVSTVGVLLWQNQTSMIEVVSQADEVKHVILPDSSEVWLNGGSTLRYPQTFAKNNRRLELQGEAYFEVRKDAGRPFMVQNDALSVRVLGTTFNFSAHTHDRTAEVTLLEGRVQVKGSHDEGMITINPNQKVVLDKETGSMEVSEVYAPLAASWHNRSIPFRNMRVEEIIKVLETYYKVEINISNQLYSKATYSGEISCETNIDSVLKDLSYTIPFKFVRKGNKVRLWR